MYAPVASFAVKKADGHLTGYAAPVSGHAPCLLELTADDVPVAVARATGFSIAAQAKSIRLGWCGVKLPGLAMATAIGTDLQVRCGVTGRSLWRHKARAPIAGPIAQNKPLTVFEIIALSRAEDASPGLAEIRPIMRQHLHRFGPASFVNATYETFLGRSAEQTALQNLGAKMDDRAIDNFLKDIFESPEYNSIKFPGIPGPFSFSFKYDLDSLDQR